MAVLWEKPCLKGRYYFESHTYTLPRASFSRWIKEYKALMNKFIELAAKNPSAVPAKSLGCLARFFFVGRCWKGSPYVQYASPFRLAQQKNPFAIQPNLLAGTALERRPPSSKILVCKISAPEPQRELSSRACSTNCRAALGSSLAKAYDKR